VLVTTAWGRVTLEAGEVGAILDEVAARDVPWSVGRAAVRTRLVALVADALGDRGPADGVEAAVRTADDLQRALTRWWPSASALALVRRVLTSPAALRTAAAGLLDGDEQARVLRPAAARLDAERWTVAEAVLVDEAVARVDGVPRTYGHIVADEAQDLSAMALRALARRCPSGSMTILGDLAQATEPGAVTSWEGARAHLRGAAPTRQEDLTVGYRVPAAVMDLANRLLPRVAPGLAPARSVRTGGREPERRRAADGAGLVQATVDAVVALAGDWASVGVIVPSTAGLDEAVARALGEAGVEVGRGARAVTGAAVSLVTPAEAKGLEFDGVVVVEPAAFAGGADGGAIDAHSAGRLLYIALTRAVQELVVVHHRDLPPEIAA
jgi:DNA helicase IV